MLFAGTRAYDRLVHALKRKRNNAGAPQRLDACGILAFYDGTGDNVGGDWADD